MRKLHEPTPADAWFFAQAGQRQGPLPLEQLRELLANGSVLPADLVWTPGLSQWAPAASLPQLADYLRKPLEPPSAAPTAQPPDPEGPGRHARPLEVPLPVRAESEVRVRARPPLWLRLSAAMGWILLVTVAAVAAVLLVEPLRVRVLSRLQPWVTVNEGQIVLRTSATRTRRPAPAAAGAVRKKPEGSGAEPAAAAAPEGPESSHPLGFSPQRTFSGPDWLERRNPQAQAPEELGPFTRVGLQVSEPDRERQWELVYTVTYRHADGGHVVHKVISFETYRGAANAQHAASAIVAQLRRSGRQLLHEEPLVSPTGEVSGRIYAFHHEMRTDLLWHHQRHLLQVQAPSLELAREFKKLLPY